MKISCFILFLLWLLFCVNLIAALPNEKVDNDEKNGILTKDEMMKLEDSSVSLEEKAALMKKFQDGLVNLMKEIQGDYSDIETQMPEMSMNNPDHLNDL